jgi:hypothetical protein
MSLVLLVRKSYSSQVDIFCTFEKKKENTLAPINCHLDYWEAQISF